VFTARYVLSLYIKRSALSVYRTKRLMIVVEATSCSIYFCSGNVCAELRSPYQEHCIASRWIPLVWLLKDRCPVVAR